MMRIEVGQIAVAVEVERSVGRRRTALQWIEEAAVVDRRRGDLHLVVWL